MENLDDSVEHFNETGNLKPGTYYFDPPLNEYEMRSLYNLFEYGVKNSIRILNPINFENLIGERNLLWFDVRDYNKILAWQNEDESEDRNGVFMLKDLASIKRFCESIDVEYGSPCIKPFRNGRDFFKAYDLDMDSNNFFDQLNESEEENSFDWLDSNELTGFDLKGILNLHFEKRNEPYRVEFDADDSMFRIVDDTGIYNAFTQDNFTIEEIRDTLIESLNRLKPDGTISPNPSYVPGETFNEYKALYNSLIQFF